MSVLLGIAALLIGTPPVVSAQWELPRHGVLWAPAQSVALARQGSMRLKPKSTLVRRKQVVRRDSKRRRGRAAQRAVAYRWERYSDTLLVRGVRYQQYRLKGTQERWLHVLRVDVREPSLEVKLLPAVPGQRETLAEIVRRYDSTNPLHTVVAAVNGYFWSRLGAVPVGLAATDGEPLQIHRYKRWSSLVTDGRGRVRLDTFLLSMWVRFPNGERYAVESLNERRRAEGIVLYTRFAGDTIPRSVVSVASMLDEEEPDSVALVLVPADTTEATLTKLRLRYLRAPALGGAVPCQVLSIDSGCVPMPLRGCVLSVGRDFPQQCLPMPGDTVWIESAFTPAVPFAVQHVWSGTPRLVRNGRVCVEAASEGTTSARFLSRRRARTALGVTQRGELLIVVVEHNGRSAGATVAELAQWIRRLGAYQALNFDGGSSSGLYVAGQVVGRNPEVASALAIVQRHSARSLP